MITFESLNRSLGRHASENPGDGFDLTQPVDEVAGVAVVAYANHGRWLADCPDPTCVGAELISFDNPVFFCCSCRNRANGNRLLPVETPAPGVRRQLEAYMVSRPYPANRNWLPHQTVAELRDENRAHHINLLPKD